MIFFIEFGYAESTSMQKKIDFIENIEDSCFSLDTTKKWDGLADSQNVEWPHLRQRWRITRIVQYTKDSSFRCVPTKL